MSPTIPPVLFVFFYSATCFTKFPCRIIHRQSVEVHLCSRLSNFGHFSSSIIPKVCRSTDVRILGLHSLFSPRLIFIESINCLPYIGVRLFSSFACHKLNLRVRAIVPSFFIRLHCYLPLDLIPPLGLCLL